MTNAAKILPNTSDWFAGQIVQAKLIERQLVNSTVDAYQKSVPFSDAGKLSEHFINRGLITPYQAKRILEGESQRLCIGAYTVRDILGNGSLGAVYRAIGRGDKKPYALKILPKRNQWNTKLARRQVEAFEKLPPMEGLVPFVDVGTSHGLHYLAWPLADGRTLEQIVRECGPLPAEEIARIAIKLAGILDLCHEHKILHGLMKPSNVLLSDEGGVSLLDFGIGAILAENCDEYESLFDTSSAATAVGRMLECAAPEVVIHSSRWAPSCDQYSLGCTLYFATTGRFPYPGGTFVDKIAAHQSKTATPIANIIPQTPALLSQAIERMMEKSPLDRFPRMASLMAELGSLAATGPVARPTPALVDERTPPPKSSMIIQLPPIESAGSREPVEIPLPPAVVRQAGMKKMMGWFVGEVSEPVQISLFCQGNGRSGRETHIHIVMHNPSDKGTLLKDIAKMHLPVRLSGNVTLKDLIRRGTQVAFHLHASLGELQEEKLKKTWTGNADSLVYTLALPKDCPPGPLPLKLYIGQDNNVIGQVDFILPVMAQSDH